MCGVLPFGSSPLLERRLVVELTTLAGPGRAARPVAAAARAAPAGALDLGGGELEAGADLVGLDLGDGALLALGGLPGAGPEPADHDAAGALLEGLGHVLGLLAPDVDAEERGLPVLPGVALADAGGDGQPEVGYGRPVGGEAQLGVVGQVADEHHLVVVCHLRCTTSRIPRRRSAGHEPVQRPSRASGEGDAGQAAWGRMTLCRITLSARKSTRESSSTVSGSASRSTTV